jgi:hypothetical protein
MTIFTLLLSLFVSGESAGGSLGQNGDARPAQQCPRGPQMAPPPSLTAAPAR